MGIKRCHLLISGRVQGVGYRMSAYTEAQQLGLTGWVRNLSDGRVEILAEGEAQPLQALIDWSHRGPSFAQVINVEIKEDIASGEFTAFDIYR